MNFLKWLGFGKKPENIEAPKEDYKDTLWFCYGINDNKPILKVIELKDGYIDAEFIDEGNQGKKHYQELSQFLNCFCIYRGEV